MSSGRFEVKYLASLDQWRDFRKEADPLLVRDVHDPDGTGYYNHSIYYDSPRYRYYQEKREGFSDRTKPRLRGYKRNAGVQPEVLFFEYKRRINRSIRKRRLQLSSEQSEALLRGSWRSPAGEAPLLRDFLCRSQSHQLVPALAVLYLRHAYGCRFGRGLRVTYDLDLRCSVRFGWTEPASVFYPILPANRVLIELKFDGRMPLWLYQLTRRLELQELSLSKYGMGIERCFSSRRRWWGAVE